MKKLLATWVFLIVSVGYVSDVRASPATWVGRVSDLAHIEENWAGGSLPETNALIVFAPGAPDQFRIVNDELEPVAGISGPAHASVILETDGLLRISSTSLEVAPLPSLAFLGGSVFIDTRSEMQAFTALSGGKLQVSDSKTAIKKPVSLSVAEESGQSHLRS